MWRRSNRHLVWRAPNKVYANKLSFLCPFLNSIVVFSSHLLLIVFLSERRKALQNELNKRAPCFLQKKKKNEIKRIK